MEEERLISIFVMFWFFVMFSGKDGGSLGLTEKEFQKKFTREGMGKRVME